MGCESGIFANITLYFYQVFREVTCMLKLVKLLCGLAIFCSIICGCDIATPPIPSPQINGKAASANKQVLFTKEGVTIAEYTMVTEEQIVKKFGSELAKKIIQEDKKATVQSGSSYFSYFSANTTNGGLPAYCSITYTPQNYNYEFPYSLSMGVEARGWREVYPVGTE